MLLPYSLLAGGRDSGRLITSVVNVLPNALTFLLKDIAKKHQRILTDMLKVQPVAAIAVADPAPVRNDRNLAPSVRINVPYMLIQLLQV